MIYVVSLHDKIFIRIYIICPAYVPLITADISVINHEESADTCLIKEYLLTHKSVTDK